MTYYQAVAVRTFFYSSNMFAVLKVNDLEVLDAFSNMDSQTANCVYQTVSILNKRYFVSYLALLVTHTKIIPVFCIWSDFT